MPAPKVHRLPMAMIDLLRVLAIGEEDEDDIMVVGRDRKSVV